MARLAILRGPEAKDRLAGAFSDCENLPPATAQPPWQLSERPPARHEYIGLADSRLDIGVVLGAYRIDCVRKLAHVGGDMGKLVDLDETAALIYLTQ